ncbi:MMPL family transporter [Corynebacterium tapiri]|uniref:MMPL family transporter n=1 Tax=Corynebacterium tapiri TaxID=1448266 RepID=A0A5C4U1G1_9CORY|nr:MMPL family transporter [Corynebacterium tapiri]TNL94623.1 MMPL family transporter [Corynebacterium tapiri]
MFLNWGYAAYRLRRIIPLVVVGLILALFLGFGSRLGDRMSQEGWEDPHASSTVAAQVEQETFGRDNSGDVILLFHALQGVADPAVAEAARAYVAGLESRHPEQIEQVNSYFDTQAPAMRSADGTTAFVSLGLAGDGEQTLKDFRTIEDDLNNEGLPQGVSVQVAGATAVADALDEGMANDIKRAELFGLPFVAVLLLIVFGSVVAALMPLFVGILSILGALGILSILAGFLQVNVFSQAVVTLLGLGLAIDYGLFMVSRFREELDKGSTVRDAVATSTATAGKTVVFSALMVIVALSGLLIFPQAFLKSVAYGAISAVGLAALLSVTALPAIFGLLGTRIDALSVRKTSRRARRIEDTWWYRAPRWSMKHAKLVTVAVVGGLLLLTLPLGKVEFGGINETYLPPEHATRQAQDSFNETFPAFRTEPVKLVVSGANNQQLVDVVMQTRQIQGLTSPMSAGRTVDGTTVLSAGVADRSDNAYVIDQLRSITAPEGVELHVGGTPAMEVESLEALFDRLPWMALYLAVVTFILMALVFGSLVQPAKAIIMTLLGLGATLGVLTLMFVLGAGSGLLGFTPGPLMSPIVVLIIAIIYGLSTDYEVFLVSRMVEARDRGESTDRAIALGTARTGTIITAAALIMIVVAAAFGLSDIVMMKYIAFGMIFALAIDATIIRMLLVPAVMHLLAEDNWWAPGFIKKLYNRIGHGHSEPAPVAVPAAPAAPASPAAGEPSITDAQPAPLDEAARGGRTTSQDGELVPFSELMKRLGKDS